MILLIMILLTVIISLTVSITCSKLFMKQQEKWLDQFFGKELERIKRIN